MKNKAVENMIRTQFNIEDSVKVKITFILYMNDIYEFDVEWYEGDVRHHTVLQLPRIKIKRQPQLVNTADQKVVQIKELLAKMGESRVVSWMVTSQGIELVRFSTDGIPVDYPLQTINEEECIINIVADICSAFVMARVLRTFVELRETANNEIE